MMRGLFGKKVQMPGVVSGYGGSTFDLDGMPLPDMQNVPTTAGGRYGNPMPQQQQPRQSFWQGGGKFTGRDALAGALAAIGDGLRGWAGGPTGAVEGLIAGRMAPQQQAMKLAEEQRKRAADLADFRTQLQIKSEFEQPEGPKPGSFEWYNSPTTTDAERAAYDAYNPVVATTWQGPTIVPRSQLATLPSRPVGGLTEIQPTIENTPAPQLGANGMPAVLSRQQYQATVNAMGKADTDAWMARNNIRVVD